MTSFRYFHHQILYNDKITKYGDFTSAFKASMADEEFEKRVDIDATWPNMDKKGKVDTWPKRNETLGYYKGKSKHVVKDGNHEVLYHKNT